MTTPLMKNSLDAFVDSEARILILGTAPGELSLKRREYYANPNNQFWSILSRVYNNEIEQVYETKLAFLKGNHIALWDVIRTFEREGSLDSSFKQTVPNDFVSLLAVCPSIRYIAFDGSRAQKLFKQLVQKNLGRRGEEAKYITLPSTSPTPGKHVKPLEEKVREWRALKNLI